MLTRRFSGELIMSGRQEYEVGSFSGAVNRSMWRSIDRVWA
jgi:hypothetical protein